MAGATECCCLLSETAAAELSQSRRVWIMYEGNVICLGFSLASATFERYKLASFTNACACQKSSQPLYGGRPADHCIGSTTLHCTLLHSRVHTDIDPHIAKLIFPSWWRLYTWIFIHVVIVTKRNWNPWQENREARKKSLWTLTVTILEATRGKL